MDNNTMPQTRRTITLRLTPEQHALLRVRAMQARMSIQRYVMAALEMRSEATQDRTQQALP